MVPSETLVNHRTTIELQIEGQDYDAHEIEKYHLNNETCRQAALMVKGCFFFNSIDLFKIYKFDEQENDSHQESNDAQIKRSRKGQTILYNNKLFIEHSTKFDRLRDKWFKFSTIFSTYFSLKFAILASVVTFFNEPEMSLDGRQRYNSTLRQFIGNPMPPNNMLSLIVFWGLTIPTYVCIVYVPFYYKHYSPIDAAYFRFIISPLRELKRLEILIIENLKSIKMMIKNREKFVLELNQDTRVNLLTGNHFHGENLPQVEDSWRFEGNRKLIQYIKLRTEKQSKLLDDYFKSPWLLRPEIYKLESYKKSCFCIKIGFPFVFILFNSVTIAFIFSLLSYNYRERCKLSYLDQNNCSLLEIYSKQDLLVTIEIVLYAMALNSWLMFLTSTLLMEAVIQFEMTKSLRKNLSICIDKLRISNQNFNQPPKIDDNECKLFKSMIELLIENSLFKFESKRRSRHMSEIISIILIYSLLVASISLVVSNLTPQGSKTIVIMILTNTLLYSNCLVIVCAVVYANILKLRISQSLLAQIVIRSNWSLRDPLMIQWRKIVLNQDFQLDHYIIKAFHITLNYRRALQFNFLILTVVSMTMGAR